MSHCVTIYMFPKNNGYLVSKTQVSFKGRNQSLSFIHPINIYIRLYLAVVSSHLMSRNSTRPMAMKSSEFVGAVCLLVL